MEFRILDGLVVLECDSLELCDRLREVGPDAEAAFPVRRQLRVEVAAAAGGYSIRLDSRWFYSCADATWLALFLHQHLQRWTLLARSDSILLHSACIASSGQNILLIGDNGVGKTTLATRHLLDGGEAACDDLALVGEAGVIPFPRRFHVKTSSLRWFPELKSASESAYRYPSRHEDFFFLSPTSLRPSWSVSPRRATTLVRLTQAPGESRIRRVSKWEMTRFALSQIRNLSPSTSAHVGPLFRLVQECLCCEVTTGRDPREALDAIDCFLSLEL